MKRVLNQFLPACFALISINSVAQVTIDTLYFDAGGIDALTYQGATSTNYGTDAETRAYWDYGPPSYATRSYYQIDLSSIPANAVVTKSTINLYATSASNGASHPLWIDRVTSSWAENTVTWATAPSITGTGRITIPDASTTNTGWQSHDITSHVQYSVVNPSLNYGWRIALQSETGTTDIGVSYASSENSTTSHRPYLIVEYRIPEMDTIYLDTDGYDAHVYSGSTGTNYGTSTSAPVNWDYGTTSYANRLFLQGDLSNIPRNAVVTNAYLYLYAEAVDNSVNHPLLVQGVTAGWTEGAITWANQPAVTTANRSLITHAATSSTGWHAMSIKALAQAAVNVPEKNYGWRVALQSESGTVDNGITYATSENATTSKRPYILVEYQMPIEIDGYVTHCTNGNNDGAISSVTATGGCYSYVSYTWNKLSGGAFTLIESGTSISDAGISGLSDGLYIFEVTDYKGVSGYQYFFVGEEGSTTNVSFAITNTASRAKYIEDTWLLYLPSSGDSTTPGGTSLIAGGVTGVGTTSDGRTLIQYFVDWDPSLDFSSVEQALNYRSTGHYQNTVSDNDAWVSRVIEPWDEDYSTWSFRPDVTPTNRVAIPATTTNGYELKNDTVDILGFIPYWQSNPGENFGFELALQSYSQGDYASRHYSSSDDAGHNLMVSYTVKPSTETSFVDSLGVGSILVNAPAGELPFNYLITTYDTLPLLDTIWYHLKDSLSLDSANFYRGHSNTRNYTFSNLPADRYYIAIYDNKGTKLRDEVVYLRPSLRLADSTGIIISGDTISVDTASVSSAKAVHFNTISLEEYAGVEIEIIQVSDDIVIGFNNMSEPRVIYEGDFEYAVRVDSGGSVTFLKNGVSLGTSTASLRDQFRMLKESNQVRFYKNGILVESDDLASTQEDDFKTEIHLKGPGSSVVFKPVGKPGPKVKTIVSHALCGEHRGSLTINPANFHGYSLTGYSLVNQITSAEYTNGGMGSVAVVISDIPVGIYNLITYWDNGTVSLPSVTTEILIGYPVIWTDKTNITEYPLNTIKPTSIPSLGATNSVNASAYNADYWIQFEHYKYNTKNMTYFELRDFSGDLELQAKIYMYWGLRYVKFTSSAGVEVLETGLPYPVLTNTSSQPIALLLNVSDPLRIIKSGTSLTVKYQNTNLVQFASGVNEDIRVEASLIGNVEIANTVASFCYPIASPVVKLSRTIDGGYYLANEGVLRVEYDEEYNDGALEFYVYQETGNDEVGESTWTVSPLSYGDNRLTFSFTSTTCLDNGYYILEIVNKKKEKRYLRFKIVNSTC